MAKEGKSRAPSVETEAPVEVIGADGTGSEHRPLVLARQIYPSVLAIIPLTEHPAFPRMSLPIIVSDEGPAAMLMELTKAAVKYVGLVLRRPPPHGEAQGETDGNHDLYGVGVIAELLQLGRLPNGTIQAVFGAMDRFRIDSILQSKPHIVASVTYMHETEMTDNPELKAYAVSVIRCIKELVQLNPLHKEELALFMTRSNLADPGRLADCAAALTSASPAELQEILETISIRARIGKALLLLKKELDISKLQGKIGKQIEEKLSKQQRDFFLREQLKAIKKELGIEKEGKQADVDRFSERLASLQLTDEARERIDEEIEKLKLLEPVSPEFNVTRNYLDWLTSLPWGVFSEENYDIAGAQRVLDRDHYGIEDVKDRILEFLSVGILKGNISGSILCFVGPPGVGKTSLGRSIADSLGRAFYRFSVGGMHDEAEIKGHRRTYIGALPGQFIQVMKTCKTANPVIMLDEIDKIGAGFRGDPASALLEALDPEQNSDFLDHYLDVRFDLSNVLFICTANQLDTIPRPLLDRMEAIKLAGYILEEKLQIARRYLLPRQLKEHGLAPRQVSIAAAALRDIADGYAREPGVRTMEKCIKKILRKSVKRLVEGGTSPILVGRSDVESFLGQPAFTDESPFKKPSPGVVTGLAYTSLGGDTLFIEATGVKTGKPSFKQTGQLGAVMVESSEIAYSYVRALLSDDERCRAFFDENAIHLHVPAGATPKDGPSAGITMAAALYSLALKKTVRNKLAMTGELSLTGRVMPVGGVKEKAIAARRANISTLIFPAGNKKDFDELPAHTRKGLTVRYAETFDDVLAVAFA